MCDAVRTSTLRNAKPTQAHDWQTPSHVKQEHNQTEMGTMMDSAARSIRTSPNKREQVKGAEPSISRNRPPAQHTRTSGGPLPLSKSQLEITLLVPEHFRAPKKEKAPPNILEVFPKSLPFAITPSLIPDIRLPAPSLCRMMVRLMARPPVRYAYTP